MFMGAAYSVRPQFLNCASVQHQVFNILGCVRFCKLISVRIPWYWFWHFIKWALPSKLYNFLLQSWVIRKCKVLFHAAACPISFYYIPNSTTNKKTSYRHFFKYYSRTLLSIVSLSRVRSSMAASQFCMRISEASFPHRELKAFLSVEGTWAESNKFSLSKAVFWK